MSPSCTVMTVSVIPNIYVTLSSYCVRHSWRRQFGAICFNQLVCGIKVSISFLDNGGNAPPEFFLIVLVHYHLGYWSRTF